MAQEVERARRVVIADDHLPIRHGVRTILVEAGYDVVDETGTGDGAVHAVVDLRPDVAILDVRMPGDGIAAAERISVEVPGTAVVMLTSAADEDVLLRCYRAGVFGVLAKDADAMGLPQALEQVLAGDVVLPSVLLERMATRLAAQGGEAEGRRRWGRGRRATGSEGGAPAVDGVEHRVHDVLRRGATIAQAARELGCTPSDIRGVVARLLAA